MLKKPGKDWLNLALRLSGHLVQLAKSFRLEPLENFDKDNKDCLAIFCGISRFTKKVSTQVFEQALAILSGLPYADATPEERTGMMTQTVIAAELLEDKDVPLLLKMPDTIIGKYNTKTTT